MSAKRESKSSVTVDRMEAALLAVKARGNTGFDAAWAGFEPTFSSKKAVRKWVRMAADEGGEDAYFKDRYMLRTQRSVARDIRKEYRARRKRNDPACIFDQVELERGIDQWKVERQNLAVLVG